MNSDDRAERENYQLKSVVIWLEVNNPVRMNRVRGRDGSIPKFQPILILEFLCQPILIPILDLKKKIIVGSVKNLYFKCTQVTQAFK